MKLRLLSEVPSSRLILIFAGWAMDDTPFRQLSFPGYSIAVVWDYSDETLDVSKLDSYDEICVLAWSYGVYMAGRFMQHHTQLPFTACVAVNGTMHPVHDTLGIAPAMFDATLAAISPRAIEKFYRRMCGGAAAYSRFAEMCPTRSIESVTAELENIGRLYREEGAPDADWDRVYISGNDLIFPPEAQRLAWSGKAEVRELDAPHLPDFESILADAFIKKDGVAEAFTRSSSTYDHNASAQKAVAQRLAELLKAHGGISGDVVEIGCGSGMFTRELAPMLDENTHLTLIDISPISSTLPGYHIVSDAETAMLKMADESVDMLLSASAVQWFNSPRRFFAESARALRLGGRLAIAVYGDKTFAELSGHVFPSRIFSRSMLERIVPPVFDVDCMCDELIVNSFDSPVELLRHFRLTGVAPAAGDPSSTARARAIISSGATTLTYNPIFLLLTKKKL